MGKIMFVNVIINEMVVFNLFECVVIIEDIGEI